MTNVLCVIPVRGGSKGIPRKNTLPIAGKPLVVWTIEQALAAQRVLAQPVSEQNALAEAEQAPDPVTMRVVVSTDDDELAEIARTAGAEVPFMRPAELAVDTAATEPVVEHAIAYYRDHGFDPEAVVLLQATSPLRLEGTIDRAVREFLDRAPEVDSMVGVIPVSPFIWRTDGAEGTVSADYDVMNRPRRQDMGPHDLRYRENGSLYVTGTHIYDRLHNRLGGHIALVVMDDIEGVDIDTPIDFEVAEAQLQRMDPAPDREKH